MSTLRHSATIISQSKEDKQLITHERTIQYKYSMPVVAVSILIQHAFLYYHWIQMDIFTLTRRIKTQLFSLPGVAASIKQELNIKLPEGALTLLFWLYSNL